MSKIKTIPASSLEDRCNRLECITEMVYALHVAEAEGHGLPRGGLCRLGAWRKHAADGKRQQQRQRRARRKHSHRILVVSNSPR